MLTRRAKDLRALKQESLIYYGKQYSDKYGHEFRPILENNDILIEIAPKGTFELFHFCEQSDMEEASQQIMSHLKSQIEISRKDMFQDVGFLF
jgi:hypothetical protein